MNKVIVNGRQLSNEEIEDTYMSLLMRLGFIETGTPSRAVDEVKRNKEFKPRVFERSEMKKIILLEDLMNELIV